MPFVQLLRLSELLPSSWLLFVIIPSVFRHHIDASRVCLVGRGDVCVSVTLPLSSRVMGSSQDSHSRPPSIPPENTLPPLLLSQTSVS